MYEGINVKKIKILYFYSRNLLYKGITQINGEKLLKSKITWGHVGFFIDVLLFLNKSHHFVMFQFY